MKLKPIMALILCLAMILSTMGTVAFANNAEADVWDGTVDISWYNDTDTEFIITTAEQWAGLAQLVNDAESYSPAMGNEDTADFGWYCGKQASPDDTANGIDFKGVTIKLAADLDLRAVYENGDPVLLPGGENLSMAPVGYSTYTPFKGTFDGQGHTIKNLFQGGWDMYKYADSGDGVYLGLFGVVEDATIKNLIIDNFAFNCEMNLGAAAGISGGNSTFDGITIKNSTIATGGGWWVGGLIGWAYGNQTIQNINIDETNTIAQVGGHYDTAVGGIIGGCNNVEGESIAFKNCNIACKLDVYNDCTANYDTNSYRNCGMLIGGVGEDNEVLIDGKKYSDYEAKGLTFDNVNVTIGEWANYTYCWSYALTHNCQRVEPGVGYEGVDVSTVGEYSITSRPFDAIFGAENAGDLNNVRGDVDVRVMEFLTANGLLNDADITVKDEAYIARTEAELYKPADVALLSGGETEWVLVDSYATLEEALATAENGYKIKLVSDIEIDQVNTADNKNGTNWNGDYSFLISIPVELTLDLNGCTIEATGGSTLRAPFAVIVNDKGLTIEDSSEEKTGAIVLNASEYSDVWLSSVIYNRSALTLNGGALINKLDDADAYAIDNTTVSKGVSFTMNGGTVASDYDTALRVGSQGSSGTLSVDINDGTVDGGIWVPLKNGGKDVVELSINGGTITANANGDSLVIENYAAASAGAEADVLSITNGVFEGYVGIGETYVSEVITEGFISGGTYINNVSAYTAEGYEPQRTGTGYIVVADQTDTDDAGKDQADSISIEYKDVTVEGTEGQKTYEIVVKANDEEMINELASVDLTFVYSSTPVTGGNIEFTVAPAADFTFSRYENTNRYMFNYNGVSAFEDTANAITVGTITVTGYGSYTIATADVATNIVNATTVNDNLVDSYTAAGATDNDSTTGGLVINTDSVAGDDMVGEVTDGNIAVPVRTLTVNLDFPNAVEDNAIAYQNMKVEITGNIDGVNQTITYNLGEDEVAMANGDYVVEEDRLVLNNAYTVTVSGAGYRTARYTVTMTEDKVLKFWNNVMDEKQFVEIGKESSKVNVTFLAGDIVKDNKINIYDLSAVVSYFGTETDTTAYDAYAKYDLNRDGVIDSKDVAYVLVSWNN